MPLPHQKLPGKQALEAEYLAGATFDSLAAKYGVRRKTVYNTMKLRAQKAGTPWPLKQGRPGWERRKVEARRATYDSITAMMIRAELQEMLAQPWAITLCEVARRAGVSQGTVWQISSGHRQRCTRATAEKIMAVVEEIEKAGRRRAQAQHALDCRRRKLAAEKAAGIRPPSQMDLRRARSSAA